MTLTAIRHAPSLSIPSTQNSAPIFEFRCLYTHDLRRKAKRWQDGLIRFHTFNRRAMVYDESKNFIGDTHCREQEPIRDGDEIKLDKGVLIQVGESVGSVEQDLTELLQKRVPKAPEPSVEEHGVPESFHTHRATPGTSSPATFTQLRPKSLNTLLGTSLGRTGRASLPSKSPYDQRTEHLLPYVPTIKPVERSHQLAGPSRVLGASPCEQLGKETIHGRPAKRQKTSDLGGRTKEVAHSGSDSRTAERHVSVPDRLPPKSNQKFTESRETITIDSDEPHSPAFDPLPMKHTAKNTGREKETPTSRPPIPPLQPPKRLHVSQESPLKNPLRLVSRKQRKKLMYRDLLPEASSGTAKVVRPITRSPSARTSSPKPPLSKTRKIKTKKKDQLTDFYEAQQKRIKTRLGPRQSVDEPLFLTSDDDFVQSFPSVDEEDFLNESEAPISRLSIPKDKLPGRTGRSSEESQGPLVQERSLLSLPQKPSKKASTKAAFSADEASLELARMDEILLTRPIPASPTVRKTPTALPIPVTMLSDPPLGSDQNLVNRNPDPEPEVPPRNAPTLPKLQPQELRPCTLMKQTTTAESSPTDPPSSPPAFQQHEHHSFTSTPPITIAVPTLPAFQPQHPKPCTTKTERAALLIITDLPPSASVFPSLAPGPAALSYPTINPNLLEDTTTPPHPDPIPPNHASNKPTKRPLRKSTTQVFKPPATVAKRTLKKVMSDVTGLQSAPAGLQSLGAAAAVLKRDDDLGPWSREAFDLFGVGRPG